MLNDKSLELVSYSAHMFFFHIPQNFCIFFINIIRNDFLRLKYIYIYIYLPSLFDVFKSVLCKFKDVIHDLQIVRFWGIFTESATRPIQYMPCNVFPHMSRDLLTPVWGIFL